MAEATLGAINQRITEIDDLVFRGNTGQIPMTVEASERLESEAASLMQVLAKALQDCGAGAYQDLYDQREKVRQLTRVSATMARYQELHPQPEPEIDALVAAAFRQESPDSEAVKLMGAVFGTIFIELPSESPLSAPRKSLLSRLFRR